MTYTSMTWTLANIIKVTLIIYSMNKNHIINNLILLEFMVLVIINLTIYNLTDLNKELFIIFFMIIILIMESILGLSIMVLMIRTHANDYLKSSTIMKM